MLASCPVVALKLLVVTRPLPAVFLVMCASASMKSKFQWTSEVAASSSDLQRPAQRVVTDAALETNRRTVAPRHQCR
jgi:hypothetical protein